eukprot:7386169-Prymnesium_polylepis.2
MQRVINSTAVVRVPAAHLEHLQLPGEPHRFDIVEGDQVLAHGSPPRARLGHHLRSDDVLKHPQLAQPHAQLERCQAIGCDGGVGAVSHEEIVHLAVAVGDDSVHQSVGRAAVDDPQSAHVVPGRAGAVDGGLVQRERSAAKRARWHLVNLGLALPGHVGERLRVLLQIIVDSVATGPFVQPCPPVEKQMVEHVVVWEALRKD